MGTLKVLPCLDSEERGLALKRILDIPGWRAAELGRTALEAARNGFYLTPEGRKVAWGNLVQAAIAAKISIPPEAELPSAPHPSFPQTEVQVANETTLEAGLRLSRCLMSTAFPWNYHKDFPIVITRNSLVSS